MVTRFLQFVAPIFLVIAANSAFSSPASCLRVVSRLGSEWAHIAIGPELHFEKGHLHKGFPKTVEIERVNHDNETVVDIWRTDRDARESISSKNFGDLRDTRPAGIVQPSVHSATGTSAIQWGDSLTIQIFNAFEQNPKHSVNTYEYPQGARS